MVTYAYLRVSTNQQDVDNQRHGILEYVNQQSLGHLEFISDSVSGQKKWRERKLGELLTSTAVGGDVIIFAEISRMARSTLQVLEILECCMQRELTVHIAKQQMVLDDNLPSRITAERAGFSSRNRARTNLDEN
ncbi:MAG: recombinase family protein [Waterburya sp.]